MTHDELLAKINENADAFVNNKPLRGIHPRILKALRAVVERHKPWVNFEGKTVCAECCNYGAETYPCVTIKDIEEELS
jgi:hypothetical protein